MHLLDFGATDLTNNFQNLFIHFYIWKKKVCTTTKKCIISYRHGEIINKFEYSHIMFTNVMYISILVYNFYSKPCLWYWVWDINIKHSRKTMFYINSRVISHANQNYIEYIMQFINLVSKLNTLTKLTTDLTTWYTQLASQGYQNLHQSYKYILNINKVSGLASNKIWR